MMTRMTKIRVVVHCWWRLWPMWCCGQLAIFQAPISHATSSPPTTAILMIVNINTIIKIINTSEKTGHSLQQSLRVSIFYCWMKKTAFSTFSFGFVVFFLWCLCDLSLTKLCSRVICRKLAKWPPHLQLSWTHPSHPTGQPTATIVKSNNFLHEEWGGFSRVPQLTCIWMSVGWRNSFTQSNLTLAASGAFNSCHTPKKVHF